MRATADPQTLIAAWELGSQVPACTAGAFSLAILDPGSGDPRSRSLHEVAWDACDVLRRAYGPTLETQSTCSACGDMLEFSIPLPPEGDRQSEPSVVSLTSDDSSIWTVRCPTVGDVLHALDADHPALSLRASVVERDHVQWDTSRYEPPFMLDDAAEDAAGLASSKIRTTCPACDTDLHLPLDLADLLWAFITAEVRRMFSVVSELAEAFGWSEADILAMSPIRREAYLAQARARRA